MAMRCKPNTALSTPLSKHLENVFDMSRLNVLLADTLLYVKPKINDDGLWSKEYNP